VRHKILILSILLGAICLMASVYCQAQDTEREAALKMLPSIPDELKDVSERAAYLAMHYWDKYDFRDTALMMRDNLLERGFADYCDVLSLTSDDIVSASIDSLMKKAENERFIFRLFSELSEKYLYEPASPVYDEKKFVHFLEYMTKTAFLDDIEKIRPAYLLESLSKNNTGDIAEDFVYTLADDRQGSLHEVEAAFTLLYFSDPGCEDCQMLTRQLIVSPIVNSMIKSGRLKILSVYTHDDLDLWKEYAAKVLHSWIYARDAEQVIESENLYNIRKFPTLYLLDKDKRVIIKDASFGQVEDYFNNIDKQDYGR